MCAGITTYDPLMRFGCAPDSWQFSSKTGRKRVGVAGIGGLGHMAVKIAHSFGCEVTAISTSPGKEAAARAIGAHHFVLSTDAEDMKRRGVAAAAASEADAAAAVFGGGQKPGPSVASEGPRGLGAVPCVTHDEENKFSQFDVQRTQSHFSFFKLKSEGDNHSLTTLDTPRTSAHFVTKTINEAATCDEMKWSRRSTGSRLMRATIIYVVDYSVTTTWRLAHRSRADGSARGTGPHPRHRQRAPRHRALPESARPERSTRAPRSHLRTLQTVQLHRGLLAKGDSRVSHRRGASIMHQ